MGEKGPKFSYEMNFSRWDLLTEFPELLESVLGEAGKERERKRQKIHALSISTAERFQSFC